MLIIAEAFKSKALADSLQSVDKTGTLNLDVSKRKAVSKKQWIKAS